MTWVQNLIPAQLHATLALRSFGFLKIPMLFYSRASVVEITAERVVVKIRLRRRTKNHLGSMYFGALNIGADCAAGLQAMRLIREQAVNISLIFRDCYAEFIQRAEGDVLFSCDQGRAIASLVAEAAASDERVEMPVNVVATVTDQNGNEPVAKFRLTLSLKRRP